MTEKQRISETTLVLSGAIAFVILAVATALLSPSIVARFYPLPLDTGAAWYFWQRADPNTLARITYWAGYAVHQLVIWIVLFKAVTRSGKSSSKADQSTGIGVSRFNVIAMAINVAFVALHLVQTYFWYDGLAQDVPIWTSQGSVIVMLVLVLYLEIPRRGLIWGKRFTPAAGTYRFVQKWHGIYIAWALTYTFWFHPMDGNWGLLSGFIYMFLLFIQLSMFNTKLHSNLAWVVLMESFVAVHATLITIYKHNPIWPMFMVGFLVMLILTQMHAIPWARKYRWPITVLFFAGVAALYIFVRGTEHLFEISFIPVALYGGALALVLVGWLADRIVVVRRKANAQ